MDTRFNDAQIAELRRLKEYFPYRVVFGALSPSGEFEANAQTTKRRALKLAREGWHVEILTLG